VSHAGDEYSVIKPVRVSDLMTIRGGWSVYTYRAVPEGHV